MIERIDLLLPPAERAGYGVLPHFTKSLAEALTRCGISCRILGNVAGTTPDLLQQLLDSPPNCTLSFNGLLPYATGEFFCDTIGIPHVACLVDSPNTYLSLAKSPLTLITCIDNAFVALFQGLKRQNVLFLPQAVQRDFSPTLETSRPYDVVFLGTCLDFEERLQMWPNLFPEAVCHVLREALELCQSDHLIPYFQAFAQTLQARVASKGDIDVRHLNYAALFEELEFVLRGLDRVALIRSIHTPEVHVFGTQNGSRGWEYYLRHAAGNVTVHGVISFEQAQTVMSQSKILLNSCPSIRDGAHERIFTGLMAGATILSNDNGYLKGQFTDHEGVLFYKTSDYSPVNELVCSALKDEDLRQAAVASGQEKVNLAHTWDHRARPLLQFLNAMIPTLSV